MYLVYLVLVLLWIHAAIATVTCPGNFTLFGEQCLQVLLGQLTWKQARDKCQVSGTGGKLAELPDTTHIIDYIVTEKISNTYTFWVGAEWNTTAKDFLWITSGSKVGNWDAGEPNLGTGENCVELVARTGKYNDNDCTLRFSTICEVAVPPVHGSTYIMIGTTTSVLLVVVIFLSIIAAYFIKKRKENGGPPSLPGRKPQAQPYYNEPMFDEVNREQNFQGRLQYEEPRTGQNFKDTPKAPVYEEFNNGQSYQDEPMYEESHTGQNYDDMPVYEEFSYGQNNRDGPMYENM